MTDLLLITSAIAALSTGLVAGAFLTFSDFVMRSLAAAEPAAGIQSMQNINREVFKTVFMVLLLGMAVLSPMIAGYAAFALAGPAAAWLIAGGVLYFVGTFLVTAAFNVPRNQRLDRMDYLEADTAVYWKRYVREWTIWNSVRTVASLLAAVCYFAAFAQLA